MLTDAYNPLGPPHNPFLPDPDVYVRQVNSPVLRSQPVPTTDPRAPYIEARPSVAERFYVLRRFGAQTIGRWSGIHGVIDGPGVELVERVTVQEQMGNGVPFPSFAYDSGHPVDCSVPPPLLVGGRR